MLNKALHKGGKEFIFVIQDLAVIGLRLAVHIQTDKAAAADLFFQRILRQERNALSIHQQCRNGFDIIHHNGGVQGQVMFGGQLHQPSVTPAGFFRHHKGIFHHFLHGQAGTPGQGMACRGDEGHLLFAAVSADNSGIAVVAVGNIGDVQLVLPQGIQNVRGLSDLDHHIHLGVFAAKFR